MDSTLPFSSSSDLVLIYIFIWTPHCHCLHDLPAHSSPPHHRKNPSPSPPGFWPPDSFRTGPVGVDRGLSFVNQDPKAFYEDSQLFMSTMAASTNTMKYSQKTYKQVFRKGKKLLTGSPTLTYGHELLVSIFDKLWTPLNAVWGQASKPIFWILGVGSGGGNGKRNGRKKAKKKKRSQDYDEPSEFDDYYG